MPPTEPYTEQIIDAIVARLGGLTAGSTYWYTPGEVGRDFKHFTEAKAFPFYGVIEGSLSPIDESNNQIFWAFEVSVIGWVKDPTDRRQTCRRAAADIQKAVYSDETWGLSPTVLRTEIISIDTDEGALVGQPHAYLDLRMRIHFDLPRTGV